ncbi:MAG: glycosyltransferase family 2 protein [Ignavibacteriaceae bacterium]|nr:glycosyltransferase family 2 protein [Ignavibacteriaceae bacterium]
MYPSSVDIVIVNWNSGSFLFNCINSIKYSNNDSFRLNRIFIVDNASTDNSLQNVENFDLPIVIIRNETNVGFAKACNQGAKNSNADYLLFLNPDTQLFNNSLNEPIHFLNKIENKNIGIVGVQILNESNEISRNCSRFLTPVRIIYMSLGLDKIFPKLFPPHFMLEWDHKNSRVVDQVMGSFFLVRRSLFEKLEGFDERFFVYFEDLDFSFRAFNHGYKSYYLSTAQIFHKGGGTSEKVKADRLAYILHSKLLYCKKHFSKFSFLLISLTTIVIEPFVRIINVLISESIRNIPEIVNGYKKLLFKLYRNLFGSK